MCRSSFQEKSRIRDIEVFICKTYCFFSLFLCHMCRSSWWYVFGDKDARDKQVRGGEGREEEELLGEEEEEE